MAIKNFSENKRSIIASLIEGYGATVILKNGKQLKWSESTIRLDSYVFDLFC